MKKLFTLLLTILCSQIILPQSSIKGTVLDQTSKPVDYAEIQLLQFDETFVKQSFTDETGLFVIEHVIHGDYILKVYYLGNLVNEQKLTINSNIDLKNIQIKNEQQLDEIVLTAEKRLVERKVDRLVYNTANSVASQGMDALEALATTPMVKVQNDKISISGKNNVRIMVDDRMLELQGDALTNYLRTLRSDDIEKIEVITTPSAKYEASGNAGIINIILKKNKRMGVYGTVSSNYSHNNYNSGGGNGSLNYQNKKWSVMLKGNINNSNNANTNDNTYLDDKRYLGNKSLNESSYKNRGASITTNYQLTDNAVIGGSYNYTKFSGDPRAFTTSTYKSYPFAETDSIINSVNQSYTKNNYHTANLFFDQKLDTLGSKIAIGANYFSNSPDQSFDIKEYDANSILNRYNTYTNTLKYNVYSINADLNYHLPWAEIEFGAKYTTYDNKAQVIYFNIKEGNTLLDPRRSNRFTYTEDNYAGYVSLTKKLSYKWNVKGGMRYEQTEAKGDLLDTNEQFTKSYGKWFPTAYISFTPNETHSFSFNYSKRINRPYSNVLNPFKYYSNSYTYHQGNPELNPSYTNNYELSYVFNGALSVNLNYYHMTDQFDYMNKYVDGVFMSSTYNMLNSDNYGIDISYNNAITAWWETNTGLEYILSSPYYRNAEATQIGLKGNLFDYYSQNTFSVNSSKTLKLLLNWYHQIPHKEDNTKYGSYSSLTLGAKLALLDKKLNININMQDIFNTGKSRGTSYYKDNLQTFSNSWNSRRFSISASYTFGNSKNKKAIKEANFEDKNRSN
ncbi:TonB-dependent receptor family protein [Myroides sp. M-43]|uniref:outer membrane beta-barrel family protein n=1 Tax=Myroides oncorhynchi TaxID=2893756 RepID=UPI001E47771D|nr:outer membrane beta-barrel family protein [Myroides oncorhynchi]MCC9042594.1 TonB-dependent receptor family protein [Myroides oncorhynchi]